VYYSSDPPGARMECPPAGMSPVDFRCVVTLAKEHAARRVRFLGRKRHWPSGQASRQYLAFCVSDPIIKVKPSDDNMKSSPAVPGGSLQSKPTWSTTSGWLATSVFYWSVVVLRGAVEAAEEEPNG
jgi:hypothetical protein